MFICVYKRKQLDIHEVSNFMLILVMFSMESTIDAYCMKYLFCGFL